MVIMDACVRALIRAAGRLRIRVAERADRASGAGHARRLPRAVEGVAGRLSRSRHALDGTLHEVPPKASVKQDASASALGSAALAWLLDVLRLLWIALILLMNGAAMVMILAIVVFVVYLVGVAMPNELLERVGENWQTVLGTALAIGAAIALAWGSISGTSMLRREVADVRTNVNSRIDQTSADLGRRIDQTNAETQGVRADVNARIDQTNERIAEGFAQISKEIRSLRPSQDTADQ